MAIFFNNRLAPHINARIQSLCITRENRIFALLTPMLVTTRIHVLESFGSNNGEFGGWATFRASWGIIGLRRMHSPATILAM